jgi:hypothetical protein
VGADVYSQYYGEGSGRAEPVKSTDGITWHGYICSKCKAPCYYDGRMGDGPILMCKCNVVEDAYWANDRR